jgi:hypothetical protein
MDLFKNNSFGRAWEEAIKKDSDLGNKSIDDLCNWISLQKQGSSSYMIGMYELQRRQNHNSFVISRIALIVSVISALVTIFNAVVSHFFNK